MKPWLLRIAICLLLGGVTAAVTAEVAWRYFRAHAPAIWWNWPGSIHDAGTLDFCREFHLPPEFVADDQHQWWFLEMEHAANRAAGGTLFTYWVTPYFNSGRDARITFAARIESGWPYPAIERIYFYYEAPEARNEMETIDKLRAAHLAAPRAAVIVDDPAWRQVRIVWWGFLFDVALFGGAWLGLLLITVIIPRAILRGLRPRFGRCVQCGYDLRGYLDEGCPECGWNRDEEGTEARSHVVGRDLS